MKYIIIVIVILIITCIILYNKLIKSKNRVENSLSQIDIQLQRRFDLIPNFVETIKGYMSHEQETFTKITELRASLVNTKDINEKIQLDNELTSSLRSIFAVSENYPELKANTTFLELSEELSNTENKIAYSRQFYNDAVTKYNTEIEQFPTNLLARLFKFQTKELFKVESDEIKDNIKIEFNSQEKHS